jgi:hypothetical protein
LGSKDARELLRLFYLTSNASQLSVYNALGAANLSLSASGLSHRRMKQQILRMLDNMQQTESIFRRRSNAAFYWANRAEHHPYSYQDMLTATRTGLTPALPFLPVKPTAPV